MAGDHRVYLGLGSNIRPAYFIAQGLLELAGTFGELDISSIYEGAAIGFDGPAFHNLVVGLTTHLALNELAAVLRELEYKYGRTKACGKFSSRFLDIDILTFDDLNTSDTGIDLPRSEITQRAFVLCPFAEIAPTLTLPGQSRDLAYLWHHYDQTKEPLSVVPFTWQGTTLPRIQLD